MLLNILVLILIVFYIDFRFIRSRFFGMSDDRMMSYTGYFGNISIDLHTQGISVVDPPTAWIINRINNTVIIENVIPENSQEKKYEYNLDNNAFLRVLLGDASLLIDNGNTKWKMKLYSHKIQFINVKDGKSTITYHRDAPTTDKSTAVYVSLFRGVKNMVHGL